MKQALPALTARAPATPAVPFVAPSVLWIQLTGGGY